MPQAAGSARAAAAASIETASGCCSCVVAARSRGCCACIFNPRFTSLKLHPPPFSYDVLLHGEKQEESQAFPLFPLDLIDIVKATQDFSQENKLGEGGFGPVYKGVLADGKEIAVKRLSRTSGQGLQEFKNEVTSTSKIVCGECFNTCIRTWIRRKT